MNIGITGANGFIGRLLVEKHLNLGDQVHILSRKKEDTDVRIIRHYGDLQDVSTLYSFVEKIDILYHCAAEIKDDSKMKAVNVEGTNNLLKVSSNRIKHWVQLSSVGVYGPIFQGVVNEEQEYNPINEYERTKLEADLLVIDAAKNATFTYAIIRPSIVFGPKMNNNSLFQLIQVIEKGFYFFLGKRGASANYIPVENVIEALYLAGTHPSAVNQIFNVSNWCTIEDFVGFISKKLSKPTPKFRLPFFPIMILAKITSFIPRNPLTVSRLNALSSRSIYSTKKIEKYLNFSPKQSIELGVESLVKQYRINK
jgi:nucleoside-diphosphate-sugar epimerase